MKSVSGVQLGGLMFFQIPPLFPPTYMVAGSVGSGAAASMRPEISSSPPAVWIGAGPIGVHFEVLSVTRLIEKTFPADCQTPLLWGLCPNGATSAVIPHRHHSSRDSLAGSNFPCGAFRSTPSGTLHNVLCNSPRPR